MSIRKIWENLTSLFRKPRPDIQQGETTEEPTENAPRTREEEELVASIGVAVITLTERLKSVTTEVAPEERKKTGTES